MKKHTRPRFSGQQIFVLEKIFEGEKWIRLGIISGLIIKLIHISLSRYKVLCWSGKSKVGLRIRIARVTSQGKPLG